MLCDRRRGAISVYAGDLAKVVVAGRRRQGHGHLSLLIRQGRRHPELYDAVVKAMKLNDYPEPEIKPLGPDDAPSILLDPSRTFAISAT